MFYNLLSAQSLLCLTSFIVQVIPQILLVVLAAAQATVKLAALPGDWSGRAWAGEAGPPMYHIIL